MGKSILATIFMFISLSLFPFATSQERAELGKIKHKIITIKPVYDYNFTRELSTFGAEFGFWYQANNMNHISDHIGFDLGFLINGDDGSLYTEIQFGRQFFGISVGPFVDFRDMDNPYGVQYTLWGNFILGYYIRGRHYIPTGDAEFSMGVYIAIFPELLHY